MILKCVRDLSELTLEEAEELKQSGAELRLSPEGMILVYDEETEKEGGSGYERDAGYSR